MTKRKVCSLILVGLLVLSIASLGLSPMVLASANNASTTELPRATLVKLWSITHQVYMAKFVGEKYIIVFESHGDVSLDGRFISSRGKAYVYKVDTEELLATLTPDTDDSYGDTWEVTSWEPFQYVKKWDRQGFFSADSKKMVEDVRFMGTDARVVDTTSWSVIPIDWGFTDTNGDHFYAVQLDYSGSTLAVGYIGQSSTNDTSKLLVYKYDVEQNKYVKEFEFVATGDYGRRLQMTLDGKYIVVGGLLYSYLDIFEYDEDLGYIRKVHYRLPDTSGLGGLGISDPYKVGYIIGGTQNGWVIIAYYNATTEEFKVLYQNKEAPDDSWFYNPFYERWIPKVTEVFALCTHRDSSRPGYGIIYDVLTNQTVKIHFADPGSPQWSAAAVSPEANYVFVGNTLYMVVKRDVQSGTPRIRFWGKMQHPPRTYDLGSPLIFKAPEADWHLYFLSGRLTVHSIYTESMPVMLTDDPDIIYGKLGNLYSRGLISGMKVVENSGSVDELEIEPIEVPESGYTPEHTIAVSSLYSVKALYGWNGHGFGGATVSSAAVIDVPFTAPMDAYSEIKLQQSLSVVTIAPVFSLEKELLGFFGLEFLAGGATYATGKLLMSRAAEVAIRKAVMWNIARSGTTISLGDLYATLERAKSLAKLGGKALTIVGIGLMIDAAVGIYADYVTYSSVRSFVMVMPIVEDPYGNRYSAVVLILPIEEIQGYAGEYESHISSIAQQLGLKDVGIHFVKWGSTWEEYRSLLEAGSLPPIDLKTAIEMTIAAKYGYSLDQLKIVGAKIVIETLCHGFTNLWDYVWGGLKVPVVTIVAGSSIQPKAVTAGGKIYEDPSVIADLLGKIIINGKEYELTAGTEGAYTDFQIQLGTDRLVFDFGKKLGYFANMTIVTNVVIKKDFQPLEDFGYIASFHYDWKDTNIIIDRIEFADMPYPMVKAERTYFYGGGNFTNDITEAFELSNKTADPTSPSGYRYYYITIENTKYIDPTDGGEMEYCKKFVFRYFYKQPPDAAIMVLLNGTKITSTLAHHATVVITSLNAEQEVTYSITFNVKYYEGLETRTLITKSLTDKLYVAANGTSYWTYDITPYVDAAIGFMKSQNKTAFVEIIAKIVDAKYNYIKENDIYTVVYYPPLSLPSPLPPGNYTVTFEVLDATDYTPIPGATIVAAYGENITESALTYIVTTNESGRAQLTLQSGIWTFKVSKDGYYDSYLRAPIYNDTLIRFYLVPETAENYTQPVLPINGSISPVVINNKPYYWLGAQVIWANGLPFEGANVSVYNSTTNELIASLITNGAGMAWFLLPAYEVYNVTVHAVNPYNTSLVYDASRTLNLTTHTILTFNTTWIPEEPELAKKYHMIVYAYDALTNQPIENVTVIVSKGDVGYLQLTNASGIAEFYMPFLGKWDITGIHPDYEPVSKTIELFENETAINLPMYPKNATVPVLPPVNGTYPPVIYEGKNYYWLSVQVLWKDGYPFCGANVSVYNVTDGSLIFQRYTNGTGMVHFLIPENASIKVTVNATHPEDPSLTYYAEKELNMTQHYYLVFTVPWESKYYQPEVWLKELHFEVHRAQGYFFGNVSHLVLLTIWTNKPQNITVLIGLYNVSGESWVSNKTVSLTLEEGINTFFEWVEVNAITGGYFKVFANITQYEYDTDPTNNWAWSEERFLKPMVDIKVFVIWRPIEQKQTWTLLPEDTIEIDIGIEIPISTTEIPAKLSWSLEKYDLKNKKYATERGTLEDIRAVEPGIIWRNVTVAIPWTSKLVLIANVTHEWEDFGYNNYVNITIPVDPDVKIAIVEKPTFLTEGQVFKVTVNITSNVEAEKEAIGWVSLIDNSTETLIKRVQIILEPEKTIEISAKAPENPSVFWIFKAPTTIHTMTTLYAGYDLYMPNNKDEFKITITSYQWLTIIAIIAIIIAVLAAIRAVTHTIHDIRLKSKKFVKRKTSFLSESIEDLKEQYRFVRKKRED